MKICPLPRHGTALAYDDRGGGPAVVLLHAFPLSKDMWRPQDDLAAELRVVAPDLPGFGNSGPLPGAATVDAFADAIAEFVQELGVGPVVLGGLSMGGYVALAFARRRPELLRGLILADTKADADDAAARAARDELIAFADGHTAADVAERLLPRLLGATTQRERPDVADDLRRIARGQAVSAIVEALRALRDRPDATPGLAAIAVPTLVIVGEEDVITPPDAARKLADRIPNARLVPIPGAGHLSNFEAPAAFNAAVRSFVETLPPT
jgi:3-oxoadipate enol-lactonase